MKHTIRAGLAAAALAIGPAALLGGCDDDPPPPPPRQDLVVRVEDAATGEPVAGVKIVAMDGHANRPLAPALVSDADGRCDFGLPLTGAESILAFGGGAWRVYGQPGLPDWNKGAGAGHPTDPMPPFAPPPLVRVRGTVPPGGAHIAGTVVDAASGEPLATAFVSDSPWPVGYVGSTDAADDVTLADGAFRVAEIPFLELPGGDVVQAVPLFVSRHGYRPRSWSYAPASGETPGTIEGVVIALEPIGDEPAGGLRGRVVRNGAPVPWVTVGLGRAAPAPDAAAKGGVGAAGLAARTDADGVFVFTGLAPGSYVVHPGYLPRDGVWYTDAATDPLREVVADATVDAGDYPVLWEIEPWLPRDGAVVERGHRGFSWSSVPGAGLYYLALDRGEPIPLTGTGWSLAAGDTLAPGPHVWTVIAVGAADEPVGTFGAQAEFWVRE